MTSPTRSSNSQPRPLYWMRALGKDDLPPTVTVSGVAYLHEKTVKHDFFAATGFYTRDRRATPGPTGQHERIVVKMSRTEPCFGLPLAWLGRLLRERELRFYNTLADVPNIPASLGPVAETGFAHAYVEGRPLRKGDPIPEAFFDELFDLFALLHSRGIAYVDANKPENILVGDDGSPHLIDFQISYDCHRWRNTMLGRWVLRRLQREDRYHAAKHIKRLAKDRASPEQLELAVRQSVLIRLHRTITKPYFFVRRRWFRRLRATGRLLDPGSN